MILIYCTDKVNSKIYVDTLNIEYFGEFRIADIINNFVQYLFFPECSTIQNADSALPLLILFLYGDMCEGFNLSKNC